MSVNRILRLAFLLVLLSVGKIPAYAQGGHPHTESNSRTGGGTPSGCTDAEVLVDQAREVARKLTEITPAKFDVAAVSSDPDHLADTLRDLKERAELLKLKLTSCFEDEVNKDGDAIGAILKPTLKSRMIDTALNYLNFVYETRFSEGDKSYFAKRMPADLEREIPKCKGIPELLSKASDFISQHKGDTALDKIMPRDVISQQDHGKPLLDCANALSEHGYSAVAGELYFDVAAIDNLMVIADGNAEAKLSRALAIPVVQTQPIIIQYGRKSCTGHVWGDENYRTINWDCN